MRIALVIEYDGSEFSGWQRQSDRQTVQGAVEHALTVVADEPITIHCAGRTDAGVHATYQVVHFDTRAFRSRRSWILGTNVNLPAPIGILWARPISDEFHARFSALRRVYDYVICNRKTLPGLWHGKVSWEYRALDVERMAEAAAYWLGEHDFSSFQSHCCQARHPVRTISRFEVSEQDGLVTFRVEANAFLQHMVRNLAGVLTDIGVGKQPPTWAKEVLDKRNRACGGITAKPEGLYLTAIRYPPAFQLPPPSASKIRLAGYNGSAFD